MTTPNGRDYENSFFAELGSPAYQWGCVTCKEWDDNKIDRVLMSKARRELRRQIEVQFTLCFDHAGKLDRFMKKERPSGRQVAEIYNEVEGRIGFVQAARSFNDAVLQKFPNLKIEAGIFILRIKTDGSVEWFDPVTRLEFLWQEHERMLASGDRRIGTIDAVNGASMVIKCCHHGNVIKYYAPFTRIVDGRLRRMIERNTLRRHTELQVSFYPSGHLAEHHELAFSIRCHD